MLRMIGKGIDKRVGIFERVRPLKSDNKPMQSLYLLSRKVPDSKEQHTGEKN